MPGGHPAILEDLADHRGVLSGIVIRQERERPDLAGAVAGLALVLDDLGDVRGVRDLAHLDRVFFFARRQQARDLGSGRPDPRSVRLLDRLDVDPVDQAAGDLGGRHARSFCWQATAVRASRK